MSEETLMYIPPSVLHPFSLQMRLTIDKNSDKFKDILHSIGESGQHDPVKARPHPKIKGEYEVGDGNTRVEVAKILGLPTVKALVKDYTDEEMMWLQSDENEIHQDITDYERARWLRHMIDKFDYNQVKLAEKKRRSQQWISQQLSMLSLEQYLPLEILNLNRFTEFHARMTLSAPSVIEAVCKHIEKEWKEYKTIPSALTIRDSYIPHAMANKAEAEILQRAATAPKAPSGVSAFMGTSPMEPAAETPPAMTQVSASPTSPTRLESYGPTSIEDVLKGFKRDQFKPDSQGGDRGLIVIKLKKAGLTGEEAEIVIDAFMKRTGIAMEAQKFQRPPKPVDTHKRGRGCPVCGRTISPEAFAELKARWLNKTLDDKTWN